MQGALPSPVPRQGITRAAASPLHCLRANCASTKKTLHGIGGAYSPMCDIYRKEEDFRRVPYSCAAYFQERELFYCNLRDAGRASSSLDDTLFPVGPPRTVRTVLRVLLSFLENTDLDFRLLLSYNIPVTTYLLLSPFFCLSFLVTCFNSFVLFHSYPSLLIFSCVFVLLCSHVCVSPFKGGQF